MPASKSVSLPGGIAAPRIERARRPHPGSRLGAHSCMRLFNRSGRQPGDQRLRQSPTIDLSEGCVEALRRPARDPEDGQSTTRPQHLGRLRRPPQPGPPNANSHRRRPRRISGLQPPRPQRSTPRRPLRCAARTRPSVRPARPRAPCNQPLETAAPRCQCPGPHREQADHGRQPRSARSGRRDSADARGHSAQGPTRTIPPRAADSGARCRDQTQPQVTAPAHYPTGADRAKTRRRVQNRLAAPRPPRPWPRRLRSLPRGRADNGPPLRGKPASARSDAIPSELALTPRGRVPAARRQQGTRKPRQVLFLAQANHEVWPQVRKRCAEPRCLSVRHPARPRLVSAQAVSGVGYLTSFGALRRYDSRPRFPKELKE